MNKIIYHYFITQIMTIMKDMKNKIKFELIMRNKSFKA